MYVLLFVFKYLLAIYNDNYTTAVPPYRVNIEVDVLAKMVEKSIAAQVIGYVDAIKFECMKIN